MQRFRRILLMIVLVMLALFLGIYCTSYALFRLGHQIIHVTACEHYILYCASPYPTDIVIAGDAPMIGASINEGIALFYTPLRSLETVAWRLVRGIGSCFPNSNWQCFYIDKSHPQLASKSQSQTGKPYCPRGCSRSEIHLPNRISPGMF